VSEEVSSMTFLVPANSNKSKLIFSLFLPVDLIIFGVGISLTFLMFLILSSPSIVIVVINLLPLLITGFLVFPIPNYHNMRVFLMEMISFYRKRREYVWRGWCYEYEQSED